MSVSLDPNETLYFTKPLQRVVESPLRITNAHSRRIAFKIKTTDPKHFCARPNQGIVEPGQTASVQVVANAMNEELLASFLATKFQILTMYLVPGDEGKALSDLLWTGSKAEGASKVHQKKLKVEFVDAPCSDLGHAPVPPPKPKEKPSRYDSRLSSTRPLISIEPNEQLEFCRPLCRRIERVLVITNIYSEPVAVKVKMNNSKRYTVRPNVRRLEPGESARISVNLIEMTEEPPLSFECKDKVMVQSAIITSERQNLPLLDIFASTPAPHSKEKLAVHEHKLGVVYLSPKYEPVEAPVPSPSHSPQTPTSIDEKKPRSPNMLAKTMDRFRPALWRHSGSGAR